MSSINLMRHFLKANIPFVITSKPGAGKTSAIQAEVEDVQGGKVITVLGSVREPTDIVGMPYRGENGVLIAAPQWANEAIAAYESGNYPLVVVFFDELRRVVPAVQNALLRVMLERVVGDKALPKEIRMVAASNPSTDGGWPLESALANRLGHISWSVNPDEWRMGMISGDYRPLAPMPRELMDRLNIESASIAAFIGTRADMLAVYPENEEKRDGAWPSPRSWHMAAHVLAGVAPTERATRLDIIASCVGTDAAVQYLEWLDAADLPPTEDVISGKFTQIVDPYRPDRTYAITANAIAYVIRTLNSTDTLPSVAEAVAEAGWRILAAVNDGGAADIATSFIPKLYTVSRDCPHYVGHDRALDAQYMSKFRPLLEAAGMQV